MGGWGVGWEVAPPRVATLMVGQTDLLLGAELGWREVAEKIGSAYLRAQLIIVFKQCHHRQAWFVGIEWKAPEVWCKPGWGTK
jgi:hypothetical protein